MQKLVACVCCLTCCLAAQFVSAQGKGNGFGRGLGNAARGGALGAAAAQGKGPAAQQPGQRFGSMRGTAANVNRRPIGAKPASHPSQRTAMPGEAGAPSTPLTNAERIQQHRLQQAEHLRSISERNGNEALMNTADRMEARANTNYQRQSGLPAQARNDSAQSETIPTVPATAVAQPKPAPRRGFWFRSR